MISAFRMILFLLWLPIFSYPSEGQPFAKGVHRILFLGNSITYNGQYVNDVIASLRIKYPKSTYDFINVGLPSETVSGLSEPNHAEGKFPRPDLHERLQRVLSQAKPDLVFACYGMNDGIYMPFDSSRFQAFQSGIHWLHTEVEKSGAKIIHLTPPVYDEERAGVRGYAGVLDDYSAWLMAQRQVLNWQVIDIHSPMKSYVSIKKKENPDFFLAEDGVHPGALGHWLMAREILKYIVGKDSEELTRAETFEAFVDTDKSKELLMLITRQQEILKNAWLSSTGHQRPGLPAGMPLNEAKQQSVLLEKQIHKLLQSR